MRRKCMFYHAPTWWVRWNFFACESFPFIKKVMSSLNAVILFKASSDFFLKFQRPPLFLLWPSVSTVMSSSCIRSKTRWSDLGGMLQGLRGWIGITPERKRHNRHKRLPQRQSLFPYSDLESVFLQEADSLLGQSSFHTTSWYMGHAWVP